MDTVGGAFDGVLVDRKVNEEIGEGAQVERVRRGGCPALDLDAVVNSDLEPDALFGTRTCDCDKAQFVEGETEVVGVVAVKTGTRCGIERGEARRTQAADVGGEVERESVVHEGYGTQPARASCPPWVTPPRVG